MGACCGTVDADTKQINKDLQKDQFEADQTFKLLLLGAGGSGKSTLFKQLQYIHGDGFEQRQRKMFQSRIHEQLIESMKLLISGCEQFCEEDEKNGSQWILYNENNPNDPIKPKVDYIMQVRNDQQMDSSIVECISYLWKNKIIQKAFEKRNEISVPDSTSYFYSDLDRITSSNYIPNDKDLLMVRYRTTGMQEKSFQIQGRTFQICDVGGQRSERRKWMHFFSGVTAVIFVVSLSSYDEIAFEADINVMVESIDVFDQQVNSETFAETPFILFLNKSDLFEEKIKTVPLTVAPCFEDFKGPPNDKVKCLEYIKQVFNETNKNSSRSIFIHVTCATNKDNIEKVFNDVQTMIIEWSLAKAGLTVA